MNEDRVRGQHLSKRKPPLKTGCEGNTFQKESPTENMPLCFCIRALFLYAGDIMNKNREYRLNYLSEKFYEKYTNDKYPEIEEKITDHIWLCL